MSVSAVVMQTSARRPHAPALVQLHAELTLQLLAAPPPQCRTSQDAVALRRRHRCGPTSVTTPTQRHFADPKATAGPLPARRHGRAALGGGWTRLLSPHSRAGSLPERLGCASR